MQRKLLDEVISVVAWWEVVLVGNNLILRERGPWGSSSKISISNPKKKCGCDFSALSRTLSRHPSKVSI